MLVFSQLCRALLVKFLEMGLLRQSAASLNPDASITFWKGSHIPQLCPEQSHHSSLALPQQSFSKAEAGLCLVAHAGLAETAQSLSRVLSSLLG